MANTSVLNAELFQKLLAQAQYAAYENSVARQIVTPFDFPANAGKVVQVPRWAGITAQVITNEGAATAKNTDTDSVDITLTEHVVYHQVTDMLRDSAVSNVLSALGDQSGRAISESIDSQVFSTFTGFDELGPGAGQELTVSHLLKAAAELRSRKLTGPFFAVLNPKQAYAVKAELAVNGGQNIPSLSNVGETVLGNYYIGSIAGITVLESGLITPDVNADAIGAVFAPAAIGSAMRGTITMETQRQAAARATDLVLTAVAGAGLLNSQYGVKLTSDASL